MGRSAELGRWRRGGDLAELCSGAREPRHGCAPSTSASKEVDDRLDKAHAVGAIEGDAVDERGER